MIPRRPTVHVVDDDPQFLRALVRTLRATALVVAPFDSALAFLETYRAGHPGCLVADVCMPEMDGLELQRVLAERGLSLPVVFITGRGDVTMAVTALKRGAVDFLEKPFSEQALFDSVRHALALDERARAVEADHARVRQRLEQLTPRESEVLHLVLLDKPAKEIAKRLNISPRTVEHHREHLMAKMQAQSWHELFVMALVAGIHQPRP